MSATRVEGGRFALVRDVVVVRETILALGIAAAVFFLTYTNGGFAPTTRAYAAVTVWWVLGVGAAVGLGAALSRVGQLAITATSLLALFAVWTLISMAWAPDSERAFAQFDQVSLYVGVLVLGIALARIVPASVLVGGVAAALTAVAVVALVSRVFPSSFGPQAQQTLMPPLAVRLSFPLGYWNGLGTDVALAYPLLLAIMTARRSRLTSALAAAPLPILAAVIYLTSSRGGFLAAGVAVVAYLLLAPQRWAALAATAVAGGAGAFSIAILVPRHALVSGETTNANFAQQGHHAMLLIGIACVLAALVWLGLAELGRRIPSPPRVVGWGTVAVVVVVGLAGIVAAHPVGKFEAFKRPPDIATNETFVTAHLLSTSGTWRWQLWSSAVSQFRAHPLNGGGAGSWQSWWLQHQPFYLYTIFPHSLYLGALGELGIIGLLLIGSAVLVAVGGAIRSALKLRSSEVAAAAACGIAFFAAAAYDWVWALAGIAVVGVGMLGVALGALPSTRTRTPSRFSFVRPLIALVAVAAILPQVVILAAEIHLQNSYAAGANGNDARARSEALAAKAVEPWSYRPYLQLAQISARHNQLDTARHYLDEAMSRSNNYTLWLTAIQIDTLRGKLGLAHRDLVEARRLFPLSHEFQNPR